MGGRHRSGGGLSYWWLAVAAALLSFAIYILATR